MGGRGRGEKVNREERLREMSIRVRGKEEKERKSGIGMRVR